MNTNAKYLAIGLIGVIVGVLISPWFYSSTWPRQGAMMGYQRGGGMYASIDRHFIEEMIPHHEGAIAMAELALERSGRQEILSLAKGIISAQERENKEMKNWYETWFGSQVPVTSQGMMQGMGHGSLVHMGGMEGDLSALASAANFDLEFIDQMIPHHEMAIMMARMLLASTERAEMKKLAEDIISSQSKEIELMRGWRAAWSK